ncbi:MAG TPA: xanthine dehydrogenase family protein subunit M [Candidatus Limnocylindrales bacterium]|nr:xanthine dehydrogenase family protein subunit M [Candidatus Limnocylindrales bacterium]
MIPAAFGYTRAASLDEAVEILGAAGGSTKVIAGGQSLLPLMKLRLAQPERLLDIGRIGELRGVRTMPDGRIAVGALTSYAELLDSPARHGLLRDALPGIGDVQVRNRGTIGGAIAHADPASDLPACLLALDAELVVRSKRGERTLPIATFFTDAFETALAPDEILTEIRLPGPREDAGSAYVSLEQPASGYALTGVAAVVARDAPGSPLTLVRVGITGVGPVAYRATRVESALAGRDASATAIAAAAEHAVDGITVSSDIHADREYRAQLAKVLTRRALEAALARIE